MRLPLIIRRREWLSARLGGRQLPLRAIAQTPQSSSASHSLQISKGLMFSRNDVFYWIGSPWLPLFVGHSRQKHSYVIHDTHIASMRPRKTVLRCLISFDRQHAFHPPISLIFKVLHLSSSTESFAKYGPRFWESFNCQQRAQPPGKPLVSFPSHTLPYSLYIEVGDRRMLSHSSAEDLIFRRASRFY